MCSARNHPNIGLEPQYQIVDSNRDRDISDPSNDDRPDSTLSTSSSHCVGPSFDASNDGLEVVHGVLEQLRRTRAWRDIYMEHAERTLTKFLHLMFIQRTLRAWQSGHHDVAVALDAEGVASAESGGYGAYSVSGRLGRARSIWRRGR